MNKKLLFIILYFYALAFSVLKTIRFPNSWSEAHWMMDYRFGFIKRGLAGAFFGFFFEKNEQNIFVLSVFLLLALYTSLFIIAYKETIRNNENAYTLLLYVIFFLCQYIIFTAHLIGYLDHLIFLLSILVIGLLKKRKIIIASLLVSISIMIHEIALFLMLPVCCFALVVTEMGKDQLSLKDVLASGLFKKIVVFLMLPVIVTLGVSMCQEFSGKDEHQKIFDYLSHLMFIKQNVADSVASAYTAKFTTYFNEESPHFFQRIFVSKGSIFFGIPILFMMYLVFKQFEKVSKFLLITLGSIVIVPLFLHAIAWDTYRIWSFPFMILFLGFWILNSTMHVKNNVNKKLSTLEMGCAVISILFVSLVPSQLLDNEIERFSLIQRLTILLPLMILGIIIIKKPQLK